MTMVLQNHRKYVVASDNGLYVKIVPKLLSLSFFRVAKFTVHLLGASVIKNHLLYKIIAIR